MKLKERDENGNLIIYKENGCEFYIGWNGEKVPVPHEMEKYPQYKEMLEKFSLSQKHKYPDFYKGIYYRKASDGSITRFYIDEEFDGLAHTTFDNLSSKRYFATTVVHDRIYKELRLYLNEEVIDAEQQICKRGYYSCFTIDVKSERRLTANRIFDLCIERFNSVFDKESDEQFIQRMLNDIK